MRLSGKIVIILLIGICTGLGANAQAGLWKLAQCIDTAISNSITIQQQINAVELSKLGVKQSKNNLLPAINGSISESLNVGKTVNPVTGIYENGTVWSTTPEITLTQNLFNGLQYLNSIKQSELIHQSSKFDFEDAKFNLTISVVNAFLQVLYANEAIKIAGQQLSYDSVELKNTSDMLYVGKKTESDLLQVKAQMRADNFTVINARSQWRIAKVNLQQLMNLPVSDTFDIDYGQQDEPQSKNLEDIGSIYHHSLVFQPIIKSYSLKTQIAIYAVKMAKGAYYPQLIFKANTGTAYSSAAKQTYTSTSSSIENIGYLQSNPSQIVVGDVPRVTTTTGNYAFGNQFNDNLNGQFSITLAVPILNYFQVRNNVKKQYINLRNAVLNEQNTQLALRRTIEQVYTNVQNSNAQFTAAKDEVEASKAAYDISVTKFEEGKEIITDLMVQKNAYIKALSDYLQAKYELLFNSKILDYYQGNAVTF